MKINVSHEAFMLAIESLNDHEHGNPSKSQFYSAYNIKNIYSHGMKNGYTFKFQSAADATLFLLRFS